MKKYVIEVVNTDLLENDEELIYRYLKKLSLKSFQNKDIFIDSVDFSSKYHKELIDCFYMIFLNFDHIKFINQTWVKVVIYREFNSSFISFFSRTFFSKTVNSPKVLAKSNLKEFKSCLIDIEDKIC